MQAAKSDIESQLSDCLEAKEVAKAGKRVVEDKMRAVAEDNSRLLKEVESLRSDQSRIMIELEKAFR